MTDLINAPTLDILKGIVSNNETVIVEFGAAWCGPCRQFLPHFTDFAERKPEIVCVKVDVDSDPGFISEFKIQSVPQVMLFKNGEYERHLEGRTIIKLLAEV